MPRMALKQFLNGAVSPIVLDLEGTGQFLGPETSSLTPRCLADRPDMSMSYSTAE
jgi:hypothetical protein